MTRTEPVAAAPAPEDWREPFIEHFGVVGDDMGLPRTMTRLLGWLVVCAPPHQSAQQIQAGLQLSAGSVSTGMNELVRAGLVERLTFPGDRRTHYRIRPGGWQQLLAARTRTLAEIRRIAEEAMNCAGDDADHRLREMRDFYALCEQLFQKLAQERP
jgi:DNA-binding transcriptional regulator GbsR (MarR family)